MSSDILLDHKIHIEYFQLILITEDFVHTIIVRNTKRDLLIDRDQN